LKLKTAERPNHSMALLRDLDDKVLVAEAKFGNELALIVLWGRYGDLVRKVVWRITRNQEDTEDVLQETYMNSFVHLRSFQGKSKFSTWLNRIAINSALMVLRRRRRYRETPIDGDGSESSAPMPEVPDHSDNAEVQLIRAECATRLGKAIRRLPSPLRDVIELQHDLELPLSQIAHLTGISLAAVKSRLLRARIALREAAAHGSSKGRGRSHSKPRLL
jgi:RNA polymerase sigma factor (sigma-70 family)